MRILLGVGHFFEDVSGGGNRVAWDAARHLRWLGHEVGILCEAIENTPEFEKVEDVLLLRYRTSKFNFNFLTRHQDAAFRILKKYASDWNPDLLWGHMPLQAVALVNAFPEVPLTYTVHSPIALEILESRAKTSAALRIKSKLGSRLERQCCENATTITVLSHYTKSELTRLHGESVAAKIQITPGWTDVRKFRPVRSRQAAKLELGWPADRPVLFTLRRLATRMGLDRLVDAANMLRDRGTKFQLYIGGTGPMHGSLTEQIQKFRLNDCVRLLGAVPEDQLATMYSAADAFVVPTRALECFGLIAVEAMSAGTPVLSTPVGALPEIIGKIEPRWLARDNGAEAIADLVRDFVEHRLPIHDCAELRQFVESNYSAENSLDRYVRTAIGQLDGNSRELAETHFSGT